MNEIQFEQKDQLFKEVVVFPNWAMVTKQLKLNLNKGSHLIRIEELPIQINPDSIRINGEGKSTFKIEGVELKKKFLEEISHEKLKEIEKKLNDLKDEKTLLQKNTNIKNTHKNLLKNTIPNGIENPVQNFDYKKVTPEQIGELFLFIRTELTSLDQEVLKEQYNIYDINQKITKLEKEYDQNTNYSNKTNYESHVALNVQEQGEINLFCTYLIPNATWNPFYEIKLFFNKQEIEIAYFGKVSQQTGEDWSDIKVILSTSKPSLGASLPELSTWFIDFYVPPPPIKVRRERSLKKKAYDKRDYEKELSISSKEEEIDDLVACCADEAIVEEPECEESEFGEEPCEKPAPSIQAEVQKSGMSVQFVCEKNEDIPSDGSIKKLPVKKDRFPVEIEYIAIPRQIDKVFIKIKTKNSSDYPFLSGEVFAFHGNHYVGKSFMNDFLPGQNMEIFLGTDDKIKIERLLLNRFQSKKGIASHIKKITYHYQTTIENFHDNEIELLLYDTLPISQNEKIKVKVDDITPEYHSKNDKNILEWKLKIPAGEKMIVNLKFSVETPKNKHVGGLND